MQRKPTRKYWEAYRALYGNGHIAPRPPKKKRRHDEDIEQIKLVVWCDQQNIRCYHPRNGGSLNPIEGAKFKRMGVRRGILDLEYPYARRGYHGLKIEMKRVDGTMSDLTPEQKDWITFFNQEGYLAVVAFGFEHAKKIVMEYFDVK